LKSIACLKSPDKIKIHIQYQEAGLFETIIAILKKWENTRIFDF